MPFLISRSEGAHADGASHWLKVKVEVTEKPRSQKLPRRRLPLLLRLGTSAQGTARAGFEGPAVNDVPVNLDEHRGMAAQRILRSAATFARFRLTKRRCEIVRKN